MAGGAGSHGRHLLICWRTLSFPIETPAKETPANARGRLEGSTRVCWRESGRESVERTARCAAFETVAHGQVLVAAGPSSHQPGVQLQALRCVQTSELTVWRIDHPMVVKPIPELTLILYISRSNNVP